MAELYLKEVQIPQIKEGKRNGSMTVNWEERQYRRKLHDNGYLVTLATITVPSINRVIVGASACSPEDQFYFSRHKGADKALGRACQQATKLLNGIDLLPSLLGGPMDCVVEASEWTPIHLNEFFDRAAHSAKLQAVKKALKRLEREYPEYRTAL